MLIRVLYVICELLRALPYSYDVATDIELKVLCETYARVGVLSSKLQILYLIGKMLDDYMILIFIDVACQVPSHYITNGSKKLLFADAASSFKRLSQ